MPIAIYARKSTESEDRQVQSLGDQISALRQLAQREGLLVSKVLQESRSAKAPGQRPEFERLRKEIEAGRITGVLTWSMSRLSRNPVDGGVIAYLLQTGRLDFIRTMERTYRPEDNALLLSIENGMATAYLQDLSRNVKRGMRGKVERGWHPCKAPAGYLNDPETREIRTDPERFPLVRRAFELAMQGEMSVWEIHRAACAMGLTVKRRKARKPISKAGFRKMLQSPFYKGILVYKGEEVQGRHEPVITEEEFALVQESLSTRSRKRSAPRRQAFAGLFTCAACGSAITGETKRKRLASGEATSYTYYHCSGWKGCRRTGIREERLTELFTRFLEAIRMPGWVAQRIRETLALILEKEAVDEAADSASIRQELERIQARKRRLADLRLDGELSAEEYREMKAGLEERQARAESQLEEARDRSRQVQEAIGMRLDLAVAAGQISGRNPIASALGKAMRRIGGQILDMSSLELKVDPVLSGMAAFEPPEEGSGSTKRVHHRDPNSLWWAKVVQLRTAASRLKDETAPMDMITKGHSGQARR